MTTTFTHSLLQVLNVIIKYLNDLQNIIVSELIRWLFENLYLIYL